METRTYVKKETIKKMNKVFAALEKRPRRLNMTIWGVSVKSLKELPEIKEKAIWTSGYGALSYIENNHPPCGTVNCLAGQALVTLGKIEPKLKIGKRRFYLFPDSTPDKARRLLGLDALHASRLFLPRNWPVSFQDRLKKAKPGTKEYLKIVKQRFEFLVKEGD